MKTTSRATLLPLVAALGVSSTAFSVEKSDDGVGQAILVPYYSVEHGRSTIVSLTNHDRQPSAVSVVVAEGRNGRAALSFNVYLGPSDTWTGAIVSDGAGAIPKLVSADESCSIPETASFPAALRPFDFTGLRDDGLGDDSSRLRSGTIELVELGAVTSAAAELIARNDCVSLLARFQDRGAWTVDPQTDLQSPRGMLSAEAHLIDAEAGTAFGILPFVIDDFSAGPRHGNPQTNYRNVRLTQPTIPAAEARFEVDGKYYVDRNRPEDAMAALFMSTSLDGSFALNDALEATTDWFVTLPTRRAYLGEGSGARDKGPFSGARKPQGPAWCNDVAWESIARDGRSAGRAEGQLCSDVALIRAETHGATSDKAVSTNGLEEGRLRLDLEGQEHALTVFTGASGNATRSLKGLPVLAQPLIEVRNHEAQPGLLASYALSAATIRIRQSGEAGVQPPIGAEACVDPDIQPAGWVRQDRTWTQTWSSPDGIPAASYPSGIGFPVPIGADKGSYRVIPFVPQADQTVKIRWEPVQPNPHQGYSRPRPSDGVWFALSPCPGDLRATVDGSADAFLTSACRSGGSFGGLLYTSANLAPSDQVCRVEAGRTYYLTVIAANPEDGLTPGEHSCLPVAGSALGCDVQATHRLQ